MFNQPANAEFCILGYHNIFQNLYTPIFIITGGFDMELTVSVQS
jgi:hypothetical protein